MPRDEMNNVYANYLTSSINSPSYPARITATYYFKTPCIPFCRVVAQWAWPPRGFRAVASKIFSTLIDEVSRQSDQRVQKHNRDESKQCISVADHPCYDSTVGIMKICLYINYRSPMKDAGSKSGMVPLYWSTALGSYKIHLIFLANIDLCRHEYVPMTHCQQHILCAIQTSV